MENSQNLGDVDAQSDIKKLFTTTNVISHQYVPESEFAPKSGNFFKHDTALQTPLTQVHYITTNQKFHDKKPQPEQPYLFRRAPLSSVINYAIVPPPFERTTNPEATFSSTHDIHTPLPITGVESPYALLSVKEKEHELLQTKLDFPVEEVCKKTNEIAFQTTNQNFFPQENVASPKKGGIVFKDVQPRGRMLSGKQYESPITEETILSSSKPQKPQPNLLFQTFSPVKNQGRATEITTQFYDKIPILQSAEKTAQDMTTTMLAKQMNQTNPQLMDTKFHKAQTLRYSIHGDRAKGKGVPMIL